MTERADQFHKNDSHTGILLDLFSILSQTRLPSEAGHIELSKVDMLLLTITRGNLRMSNALTGTKMISIEMVRDMVYEWLQLVILHTWEIMLQEEKTCEDDPNLDVSDGRALLDSLYKLGDGELSPNRQKLEVTLSARQGSSRNSESIFDATAPYEVS